jgi:hypothetical protein
MEATRGGIKPDVFHMSSHFEIEPLANDHVRLHMRRVGYKLRRISHEAYEAFPL